jgi:hypothetical protein
MRAARIALLLALLLFAPRGHANISQYFFEGDRSTILVPGGTTTVRVDHEELSFVLNSPDLAKVTAIYHLTNAGAAAEADDVAFAFVRGERRSADADARSAIQVDGAPLPFRAITDPDLEGRWSMLRLPHGQVWRDPRGGVGLLLFHLDFEPGKTLAVTVRYEQTASEDDHGTVNGTSGFDYLLSPAKSWAGFGPLDVSVRGVPESSSFSSPLPFAREGDTYRAHFESLPSGELHFETTSRAGLWFGMTKPDDYAAILLTAVLLATLGVSAGVGWLWAGVTDRRRVLLPLFVAGPLAAMSSLGVTELLWAVFPYGALGHGYGNIVLCALLVFFAMPLGAAVSAVSAARRSRALVRARALIPTGRGPTGESTIRGR